MVADIRVHCGATFRTVPQQKLPDKPAAAKRSKKAATVRSDGQCVMRCLLGCCYIRSYTHGMSDTRRYDRRGRVSFLYDVGISCHQTEVSAEASGCRRTLPSRNPGSEPYVPSPVRKRALSPGHSQVKIRLIFLSFFVLCHLITPVEV
jgi:hypothetical protein